MLEGFLRRANGQQKKARGMNPGQISLGWRKAIRTEGTILREAYSRASASIGSSFEALLAGRKPKAMPIMVEHTNAAMMDASE